MTGRLSLTGDAAVDTARDLLDGQVCECGHTLADHVKGDDATGDACDDCACTSFRPVVFTVERKR